MNPELELAFTLTVVGLGIVFAVLATIATVVWILGRLDARWRQAEEVASIAAFDKTPTIDDLTLVLISAAVATTLVGRYRIRSVKRLLPASLPASSWTAQGRAVLLGSHLPRGRDR